MIARRSCFVSNRGMRSRIPFQSVIRSGKNPWCELWNLVPINALGAWSTAAIVLTVVIWFSDTYLLLINAGAALESLIYALSSLLVINLRHREPSRSRMSCLGSSTGPDRSRIDFFNFGTGRLVGSYRSFVHSMDTSLFNGPGSSMLGLCDNDRSRLEDPCRMFPTSEKVSQ